MGSEELTDKNPRLPIRGVLAVIGAFLINLILGAYYSFGNIMPYLVAYMRERGDLNVTYRYLIVWL